MKKKHREKTIFYRLQNTKRSTEPLFESLPKCTLDVDDRIQNFIQREEYWIMSVGIIITFLSILVYGACLYWIGSFLWDIFF
jgi:hypothetical protein